MFLTIDDIDTQEVKTSTFPTEEYIDISSVIIDDSGLNNTSVKATILLQDDLDNLKVFNNINAKKMMFLRLFEISSAEMQDEVLKVKNIKELNDVLQKNKVFYKDTNAAVGFIGDNKNIYDHYTLNNRVFLNYTFDFVLAKKNPQYLSLGAVFYYDTDAYSLENDLPKSSINYEMIFGFIKNINVIDNFLPNSPSLKDLRVIKNIFSIQRLYEQINIKTTGIKQQSVKTKKIPNNQYFSNAYISKKSKDVTGLAFSIDYHRLMLDNSPLKDIMAKSDFVEKLLNKSYIADFSIKRRLIKKTLNSYDVLGDFPFTLINTADNKNTYLLTDAEGDYGAIREVVINTASDLLLRTFLVEDRDALKNKKGLYQYGFEIKIVDGIVEYLQDVSKMLSEDNSLLRTYLSETDKLVTTVSKNANFNPHIKSRPSIAGGFYDPLAGKFNSYFLYEYFPKKYEQKVLEAVSRFTQTLQLFGMLNMDVNKADSVFISMLNPAFATAQTIQYFISAHERLISEINKVLKNTYNNYYSLEYWFENDFLQADAKPEYGYSFFDVESDTIYGSINSDLFNARITDEITKYSKNGTLTSEQDKKKYSYLSPNDIFLEINSLNLDKLVQEKDAYFLQNYKNAELEIRRYNSLKNNDKDVMVSSFVNNISLNQQREILKNNRIFSDNSISIDIVESKNLLVSGSEYTMKNDIDPTMLHLGFSKYFDAGTNTFSPSVNLSQSTDSLQTQLLDSDNSRFFENPNKQNTFQKDLDFNSKYLFLYSTIHQIEYLSYDQNLKQEKWSLFDQTAYNNLQNTKTLLCRLKVVDGKFFEHLQLPIYNKYFIMNYKQETARTFRKKEDNIVESFARPQMTLPVKVQPPPKPPKRTLSFKKPVKTFISFAPEPQPQLPPEPKPEPPAQQSIDLPTDGQISLPTDTFNSDINGNELARNTRYSLYNRQNIVFVPGEDQVILASKKVAGEDFSRYLLKVKTTRTDNGRLNQIYLYNVVKGEIMWQLGDGSGTANNVWEIDDDNNYALQFITVRDGQMQIFTKGNPSQQYKVLITAGSQNTNSSITNSTRLVLQEDGNLVLYTGQIATWATNTNGGKISKAPKNYGNGTGDPITVIKGIN